MLSNNECISATELSQMSFTRSCENTGLLAVTPVYHKQCCGSRYCVLTVGWSKGRKSNKRSVSIRQRTAEHQEWSQSQVDGTPDRPSSLHHAAAFLFPGWLDSFSPQPWAKQATSERMNFASHSAVGHSDVRLIFFFFLFSHLFCARRVLNRKKALGNRCTRAHTDTRTKQHSNSIYIPANKLSFIFMMCVPACFHWPRESTGRKKKKNSSYNFQMVSLQYSTECPSCLYSGSVKPI